MRPEGPGLQGAGMFDDSGWMREGGAGRTEGALPASPAAQFPDSLHFLMPCLLLASIPLAVQAVSGQSTFPLEAVSGWLVTVWTLCGLAAVDVTARLCVQGLGH